MPYTVTDLVPQNTKSEGEVYRQILSYMLTLRIENEKAETD